MNKSTIVANHQPHIYLPNLVFSASARIISTWPCNSLDSSARFSKAPRADLNAGDLTEGPCCQPGSGRWWGAGLWSGCYTSWSGRGNWFFIFTFNFNITHIIMWGCYRFCCCCLLAQFGLKVTCGPSLNYDDVLQHKVKVVENLLVPLSIVSCPIPRLGLR